MNGESLSGNNSHENIGKRESNISYVLKKFKFSSSLAHFIIVIHHHFGYIEDYINPIQIIHCIMIKFFYFLIDYNKAKKN